MVRQERADRFTSLAQNTAAAKDVLRDEVPIQNKPNSTFKPPAGVMASC